MFSIGKIYKRTDLHKLYKGQTQGGISTPANHNLIMIFTGEVGGQFGYQDGWNEDGLFLYTGEGQTGDMAFIRGNLAIRDHNVNCKDLHLFQYVKSGHVRYIEQMICTGFHTRKAPDRIGNTREAIIFELSPIDQFTNMEITDDEFEEGWQEDIGLLRSRAIASASTKASPIERKTIFRKRSSAIKIYVLKIADGLCETCGSEAPFITPANLTFISDLRALSRGGQE